MSPRLPRSRCRHLGRATVVDSLHLSRADQDPLPVAPRARPSGRRRPGTGWWPIQQFVELRADVGTAHGQDACPSDGDDPKSLAGGRIRELPLADLRGGLRADLDPVPNRLAQQALGAVSGDGPTDLAASHHGQGAVVAGKKIKHEEASQLLDAILVYSGELTLTPQGPPAETIDSSCGRDPAARRQADRRLRPLARRRLSTRRPARVDIRLRKPCLWARFRLLG